MFKRMLFACTLVLSLLVVSCQRVTRDASVSSSEKSWRMLPLIAGGKVDPAWMFTGFGGFTVDGDAIRAEPDARGLGLLVYTREKLGDCQIRVVYRLKHPRVNSGVYVRIDDGILAKAGDQSSPATRDANGKLTADGAKAMEEASERELGAWYAVHHGYEVQIADGGDAMHRTGAVYSLTPADEAPPTPDPQGWRTMLITLKGDQLTVDVDGHRVSSFNAADTSLPKRDAWHEPKREPIRPTSGYIGLQSHDPGDVVWFKDVSVRPL